LGISQSSQENQETRKVKYVVIRVGNSEVPIMFSELIFHADIVRLINNPIISAGFVQINPDGELECMGMSSGLEIYSRGSVDAKLISQELEPFSEIQQRAFREWEKDTANPYFEKVVYVSG
jgi:hypothetical protein